MFAKPKNSVSLSAAIGVAAFMLALGLSGGYFIGKTWGAGPVGNPMRAGFDKAAFAEERAARGDSERQGSPIGTRMDMVTGDIVSIDGSTVTVGLSNGSSKVIVLTSETSVSQMSVVDITALTPGTHIFVTAKPDDSGNLIATQLQIRPDGAEQVGVPNTPPPDAPTGQ